MFTSPVELQVTETTEKVKAKYIGDNTFPILLLLFMFLLIGHLATEVGSHP